jgi:hypothetical protein
MNVEISSDINDIPIDEQEHCTLIYLQLPRKIRFRPLRQRRIVSWELAVWYLGRETVGVKAMNVSASFQDLRLWRCRYCWNEGSIVVESRDYPLRWVPVTGGKGSGKFTQKQTEITLTQGEGHS